MTGFNLRDDYERAWPRVKLFLPEAQIAAAHMLTTPLQAADYNRIHRKGERGWREHAGGIRRFSHDEILAAAREECDDLLFYLAWPMGHPRSR